MAETTYLLPHCIEGENVSECLDCLQHLHGVISHLPSYQLSLVSINITPNDVTITLSDPLLEEWREHLNLTLVS